MNSEKLYSYLENQLPLTNVNLVDLEKLTEQFPYFQTAHLLYSIASKKNDASLFQKSIKKTAIIAVSRNHLYNLLYINSGIENPKPAEKDENLNPTIKIEEVKTKTEEDKRDISEQVEKEIQKDLVEAFVEKEILKTNEAHKKEEAIIPKDATFGDWLHFLKKNNGQTFNEEKVNTKEEGTDNRELKQKKEHQRGLIDKIIEQNLGTIKLNKETKFFAADQKAKESLLENEDLVTETLAKIYALQGNINKAIRAYQILSLKYPNKSVYFASLIENLKKDN